jgi:hypothetical protein
MTLARGYLLTYHFVDYSDNNIYSFNQGPSQRFITIPERVFTNTLITPLNNEGPGNPQFERAVVLADQLLAPIKLTTIKRVRIRLLWELGWIYSIIANNMNCSIRQVNHYLIITLWTASENDLGSSRRRGPRPRDRRGRRPLLDIPKRQRLV